MLLKVQTHRFTRSFTLPDSAMFLAEVHSNQLETTGRMLKSEAKSRLPIPRVLKASCGSWIHELR